MQLERPQRQPISLHGLDNPINIESIPKHEHELVHTLCDISNKLYSKMLRKQREATSGNIVMTEKGLKIMHEMQQIYFEGEKRLPKHLQEKGDGIMSKTIEYWDDIIKKMTGDSMDRDWDGFTDGLILQQEIQLEVQKNILNTLRKQYVL